MEKSEQQLKRLVQSLQGTIKDGSLNSSGIKFATESLTSIGYQYNANLYPELSIDANLSSTISDSPNSLAEALLWKMGKWNIYRDFVNNYNSDSALVRKSDVVFSAFAKHLKNSNSPIYDQHTLRAMWAINTNLTPKHRMQCKSVLIKSKGEKKGEWKSTLSGSETIACYELYVAQLNELASNSLSKSTLDKLLMPLGQALKFYTKNYDQFSFLCRYREST